MGVLVLSRKEGGDAIRSLPSHSRKSVVITGATAGVGRALALRFARDGAPLGLIARDPAALQDLAKKVEALGAPCQVVSADVADAQQVMAAADVILLGSPNYFTDVTSEMKALIDRCGMVSRANGNLFRRKLGAAVVASGRAGAIHAFDTMNHFFLINQMIIIGSTYLNIGLGQEMGEVADDQDGLEAMRQLGDNMLWILKKLTD